MVNKYLWGTSTLLSGAMLMVSGHVAAQQQSRTRWGAVQTRPALCQQVIGGAR